MNLGGSALILGAALTYFTGRSDAFTEKSWPRYCFYFSKKRRCTGAPEELRILLPAKKVAGGQLVRWWGPLFRAVVLRIEQELLPIRDEFSGCGVSP